MNPVQQNHFSLEQTARLVQRMATFLDRNRPVAASTLNTEEPDGGAATNRVLGAGGVCLDNVKEGGRLRAGLGI